MGVTPRGINYEETKPPTFSLTREGITATRELKIAWEDVDLFMLEVFPGGSTTSGGTSVPQTARFPGKPYLYIQNVEVKAFDEENPGTNDANGLPTCSSGATCTLTYGTADFRENSTEDNPNGQDGELIVSKAIQIGGDYLTLPAKGLKWVTGFGGTPEENQFEDIQAAKLIPQLEYVVTLHRVPYFPADIVVSKIGRVNELHDNYFNAPPETLLYVGCNATMKITTEGAEAWEIEHRFLQRVIWEFNHVANELQSKGWNHFLKPDDGMWYRIQVKGGDWVYNTTENFDALFFPNTDAEFSSSQT